ncbi:MAG: phosphate ABC transporter substrate-binding protein PstS family protein [Actinomycetota bacterium]
MKLRRIHNRPAGLVPALVAVAVVAAACGGDSGSASQLEGEIVASGSSTVEPITSLVAQKFSQQNPGVRIEVNGPGTGDGFELFCAGKIDISDASRAIEPEEIRDCEKEGIEFVELEVGIDGITVMTGPDNEQIDCLDFYDLYALLGPESEGFRQWSDADDLGREIGASHAPYPDAPLDITAPGEESGTYDSFGEIVLEDIAYEERGVAEDAPVIRKDYQSSPNDNVIIRGVAGTDSSLGWVGFSYYVQNEGSVKAIPIAEEGDDCVEPTTETIQDGSYPLSRDLFFYVNRQRAEDDEALRAFVDYYLSEEGLASVAEAGYVDQPRDEIEATRKAWETMEAGTRED